VEVIEVANAKKRAAQRKRKDGEYNAALQLIDEAIRSLDEARQTLSEAAAAAERGRKLAEAIGDAYGTKGGILRSFGKYDESCAAYDAGYQYEGSPQYGFANSYNLTQRLVARFLAAPERFALDVWRDKDVVFPESLEQAERTIRDHMAGPRLNDPWAMADQAMLLMLLGRDVSEEQSAWRRIKSARPPAYVFSSTLEVVNDLRNRVGDTSASTALRLEATRARLEWASHFLSNRSD
jgi:tetratricopeptide (TPR) repeat protein